MCRDKPSTSGVLLFPLHRIRSHERPIHAFASKVHVWHVSWQCIDYFYTLVYVGSWEDFIVYTWFNSRQTHFILLMHIKHVLSSVRIKIKYLRRNITRDMRGNINTISNIFQKYYHKGRNISIWETILAISIVSQIYRSLLEVHMLELKMVMSKPSTLDFSRDCASLLNIQLYFSIW